jgi:hypothetical protein
MAILSVRSDAPRDFDRAGAALAGLIFTSGHELVDHAILPDNGNALCTQIDTWIDSEAIDLVLTTRGAFYASGTGLDDVRQLNTPHWTGQSQSMLSHPTLGSIHVTSLSMPLRKAG